ncbi:MAG: hypothetical protein KBS64_00335 [Treponema sp.]|nr:hypothetical protein [Candidatus Treponema equi]
MDINDIFAMMFYDNAVNISRPEELDSLRNSLEENFTSNCFLFGNEDPLEVAVKETVFDEAVCDSFDETIIRKALELGYYPMSQRKRVTKLSELKYTDFKNAKMMDLFGEEIFRDFLTIKYHSNKLIIPFEKLHITKKLKGWLEGKFSGYTLTFNKAYNQCIEELLKAYPETWLSEPLLRQFKKIHENPDSKVSIDSVELWHDGELVAGELGFITGNAYASLSGFHKEDDAGTVQMCVLGLFLKNNGFAYWDLGMELEYKFRYGAIACDRDMQEAYYASLSKIKAELQSKEILLSSFLELI